MTWKAVRLGREGRSLETEEGTVILVLREPCFLTATKEDREDAEGEERNLCGTTLQALGITPHQSPVLQKQPSCHSERTIHIKVQHAPLSGGPV